MNVSMCGFFQERADEFRSSMSDGKRNITSLMERVQTLQSELSQSQLRRSEIETELCNTQEVREQTELLERCIVKV